MRIFCLFLLAFILNGCETNYYLFDGTPDFKKNQKAIEILTSKGFVNATYHLKDIKSDTAYRGEVFEAWDFEQYRPPVLKNIDDTINYIVDAFIKDRLLEIYNDGKELKYHFSCYVNAAVFDDYILQQKKRIPYDDSTSFSAQLVSDSLHIFRHSIQKDSTPVLLAGKIKCRKIGAIFQIDSWLGLQDFNYDYLSVIDTAIYSVNIIKDSADKSNPDKPHYIIGKISASKESITYRELPYYPDSIEQHINDSIIASVGLKVKDRIIGYNEAGLSKIFESPVAAIKFELQKLHNFPSERNRKSEYSRILLYGVVGVLLIIGISFFRRKKRVISR
jgi:hypothetical protein